MHIKKLVSVSLNALIFPIFLRALPQDLEVFTDFENIDGEEKGVRFCILKFYYFTGMHGLTPFDQLCNHSYSYLNVSIGSTRAATRAGSQAENNPTSAINTITVL